jgi:phosphoenolpyruvate synthase/pyruvate phosphate dikinase
MASNISERDGVTGAGIEESTPLVLGLEAVGEGQRAAVGGKAANLAVLLRAGMPVPRGFCITTAAFDHFLAACPGRARLSELLSHCATARTDRIAALSREARLCLAESVMPMAVRDAVLAAWRGLGKDCGLAVRSSATVEDAPAQSFAGQFESVLNVRGADALLGAIQRCWLSVYSERALVYLARQRVEVEKVPENINHWTSDRSGGGIHEDNMGSLP